LSFKESDWHRERGRFAEYLGSSGRFDDYVGSRGIDVEIDVLSPCLIDTATGKICDTLFSRAKKDELKGAKKRGWRFNWAAKDLDSSEIYKVTVKGDTRIQGLIALKDTPGGNAVYVNIVETAPHNAGDSRKYDGVGGHLFAIAIKRSLDLGYGGYLFMDAKNMKLVDYYNRQFGAERIGGVHPYRMILDEEAAKNLIEVYTLQEE